MTRYTVLSATSLDELTRLVNDALKHPGVKLIGGVSIIGDRYGNLRLVSQAVLYL